MKGYRVRGATAKDLETLVRQRHKMFEEMRQPSEKEHRVADKAYRTWAREKMKSGLLRCLLVTDSSGKVVSGGCAWLREVQPAPGRPLSTMPYLMSMYTEPAFRRRGLAGLIVRGLMEWARDRGYARMTMHASEAGRGLYSELGWERSWEMRVDLPKASARREKGPIAARARSSRPAG